MSLYGISMQQTAMRHQGTPMQNCKKRPGHEVWIYVSSQYGVHLSHR